MAGSVKLLELSETPAQARSLKVLEEHGIYVDLLAGTSAGTMTGVLYAAGLEPEYLTRVFKSSLQPPWFFRHLQFRDRIQRHCEVGKRCLQDYVRGGLSAAAVSSQQFR